MSETLEILSKEEFEELKDAKHNYPFENLVFNGGGAKCIGGIGTLKVFHELGILPKIKRFAGTSGGALTAAFAAIGYSPQKIEEKLGNADLNALVKGTGSLWKKVTHVFWSAWNILANYGVYNANDLEQWLREEIGNLTFEELYNRNQAHIELAITVTDLARKDYRFYHVKTTPTTPIVEALRMSMSIPGIFTPVKVDDDDFGCFVDGGLLRNYPLMSYD
ncbi:uncharacterized protein YqhO-like, partial [Amphiura filiformis]|uniref:uncharacterized protein YqhO-like n=1 Tax=Amphiura filiformis TaxID=82378 RepID=UPI003B226BC4